MCDQRREAAEDAKATKQMRSTMSWWRFRSCKFIFPNFKQVNQNMEVMQNFGDGCFFPKPPKETCNNTHPWPLVDEDYTPSVFPSPSRRPIDGPNAPDLHVLAALVPGDLSPEARRRRTITGWWFQPSWKICSSNWKSSPIRGENQKYLKPPPGLRTWHCRPGDDYGNTKET